MKWEVKSKSLKKVMSKYKYYWSSRLEGKHPVMVVKNISDDKDTGKVPDGNKLVEYGFVQKELKNILGKVLTIIDASIIEPIQNKAIKDIIRNEFIDEYYHLSDMLIDQKFMEKAMKAQDMPDFNPEEIGIEEVAGH